MDRAKAPLRVLIVDDSDDDATLVLWQLRGCRQPIESRRVETAQTLIQALESQAWDLIICDYRMPRFSAPAALAIVRSRCREVPFIIVSATIEKEVALAALKAGANDYVMKDELDLLLPTVQRELNAV